MAERADDSLLAGYRHGDQEAAAELFRRYADRLIALARSRLSSRLARHVDPEDAVHSAYRSFFADARAGRYQLERGGDLWQLLVTITLHKVQRQVERHTSKKRDLDRERPYGSEDSLFALCRVLKAREPSPLAALVLSEQVEQLMQSLDKSQQRILELRLQGHSLEEIAQKAQCTEAKVRRLLDRVKRQIKRWHSDNLDA
jgi:RNA polymerase sigma-70 factor (ECF subfamily)